MNLASNSTLQVNSGTNLSLNGPISGAATLAITGNGGGFISFGPSASSALGAGFFTLDGVQLISDLPPSLFAVSVNTNVGSGNASITTLTLPATAADHVIGGGMLTITNGNSGTSFGMIAVDAGSTLEVGSATALGAGGSGNILRLASGTTLKCGNNLSGDPEVLPQAIYYQTSATIDTFSKNLATSGQIMSISSGTSNLFVKGGDTFIPQGRYVGNPNDSIVVQDSGTTLSVQSSTSIPATVQLKNATVLNLASGTVVQNVVIGS